MQYTTGLTNLSVFKKPSNQNKRRMGTFTKMTTTMTACTFFTILCAIFITEIGGTVISTSTSTSTPSVLGRQHGHSLGHGHGHHKCYVCLPQDKTSSDAWEIINLFKDKRIPDCMGFETTSNKTGYEFTCPQHHRGCQIRTHGGNISRSCAQFQFNDCKIANSKELCFCKGSLCNGDKNGILIRRHHPETGTGQGVGTDPTSSSEEKARARLLEEKEEVESHKYLETDDEDLLEMADDTGSSGDGEDGSHYPPGVIDAYTTTPKPTLVPNIRGEISKWKTTTPTPIGGVSRRSSVSSLLILIITSSLVILVSQRT